MTSTLFLTPISPLLQPIFFYKLLQQFVESIRHLIRQRLLRQSLWQNDTGKILILLTKNNMTRFQPQRLNFYPWLVQAAVMSYFRSES